MGASAPFPAPARRTGREALSYGSPASFTTSGSVLVPTRFLAVSPIPRSYHDFPQKLVAACSSPAAW